MTADSTTGARRAPVVLLTILLGLLLVMSAQVKGIGSDTLLEEALMRLAAPVLHAGYAVSDGAKRLWHGYVHLRHLRATNDRLRAELDDYRRLAVRWEEVRRENERLAELLHLRGQGEIPSVAARVMSVLVDEHAATLLVDQGTDAGVRRDMPVVTERGVVGRVIAVSDDMAKIQLVVDPNSGVAAMVESNRLQGVVRGEDLNRVVLDNVYQLEQPTAGDLVLTSGLDLLYPKGLVIGRVVRVRAGAGPIREVEIETGVDFRRLEEVLVLQYRPEVPFAGEPS